MEYEQTSDRTITFRGDRDVVLHIGQDNLLTHSFTILPMISMSGTAPGKLFICLQERGNQFGPRVLKQVEEQEREYGNIVVRCSTSGKMTTEMMKSWIHEVVAPVANRFGRMHDERDSPHERPWRRILIVGDAWGGNSNDDVVAEMKQIGAEFLKIPPGTTADLQPLDVDFFRQYKLFVKRIWMELQILDRAHEVTSRADAISMHSLIWDQFQAPCYSGLIRYAWRGIDVDLKESDPPMRTASLQFNSFTPESKCEVANCTKYAFVRCAHCQKLLCIDHFLHRTCFHHEQLEDGQAVAFDDLGLGDSGHFAEFEDDMLI